DVEPFVLNAPGQFHPHPPPPLTSQTWVADFAEIKALGAAVGSNRSGDQTAVARFWTANVIRQYNRVGRDLTNNSTLANAARLLAMINVVGADAQIAVMHWKYELLRS